MATAPRTPSPIPIFRPACNICAPAGSIVLSRRSGAAHARHGDRPEILHYLAVCLSQRGALGDAEVLWRKAIAKDPNEPMLSYNLGLVARRLGKLDEAASVSATPSAARRHISRRGWHWPASISTSSASPPPNASCPRWSATSTVRWSMPRGRSSPDAGAQPQHAGPRALSPRPLRAGARDPRARLARRRRRGHGAPRSRATARWRWAASVATTRRLPRPSRR